MIAFIDDHRGAHGVEPICKVLPIAPSTYHAHVAKRRDPAKLSARARQDVSLKIEVRRVFDENFRVYGVRKVRRDVSSPPGRRAAARVFAGARVFSRALACHDNSSSRSNSAYDVRVYSGQWLSHTIVRQEFTVRISPCKSWGHIPYNVLIVERGSGLVSCRNPTTTTSAISPAIASVTLDSLNPSRAYPEPRGSVCGISTFLLFFDAWPLMR